MSATLFLRKRRVLLAIFLFSLTYFIVATYKNYKTRVSDDDDDIVSPVKIDEILKTVKPLVLDQDEVKKSPNFDLNQVEVKAGYTPKPVKHRKKHSFHKANGVGKQTVNSIKQRDNLNLAYNCRNSVQGRAFIADENGYFCDRFDLQVNGCCKINSPSTVRYKCDTCSSSGCCSLYEQCVSCCLHPQKVCQ